MAERRRLLAGAAGAALLIGAVLVLRAPEPPAEPTPPPPERVTRYAADSVILPSPGDPPDPPTRVRTAAGPTWQTVTWTGTAPGYEVRWPGGSRLVAGPEAQLDGVPGGAPISVRAVDAYGRRSAPAETTGAVYAGEPAWRSVLTGLYDDFGGAGSVHADAPGSRWHLSGYRGCVDVVEPPDGVPRGLTLSLGCGTDVAVLRARAPMALPGGVGRVAVLTDAAAAGGRLEVDLVPGPADRVGVEPPGVRAVLDDGGAAVLPGGTTRPVPQRGAGVLHLVEVELRRDGVSMLVDGRVVATSSAVPHRGWAEAHVLLGLSGPRGRRASVHVAGAGFSGPAADVPRVLEVPVNTATRRVLGPDAEVPALGIARDPLAVAARARVVAVVATPKGVDPTGFTVQLGATRLPARLAVPFRPGPGAIATVIADVPAALLRAGPALSPFVVRASRDGTGASVLETYLEIAPTADADFPPRPRMRPSRALPDALPLASVVLGDSSGRPLIRPRAPAHGRLVLDIRLDGRATQWDSGAVAGVLGFEVRVDGRVVGSLPTAVDGPSAGGRYTVAVALSGLAPGPHALEVRVLGVAESLESSTVVRFEVE